MTQKEVAAELDRQAALCYHIEVTPASGKQCWFLASLMVKAGDNDPRAFLHSDTPLTSREASRVIDSYLKGN